MEQGHRKRKRVNTIHKRRKGWVTQIEMVKRVITPNPGGNPKGKITVKGQKITWQ